MEQTAAKELEPRERIFARENLIHNVSGMTHVWLWDKGHGTAVERMVTLGHVKQDGWIEIARTDSCSVTPSSKATQRTSNPGNASAWRKTMRPLQNQSRHLRPIRMPGTKNGVPRICQPMPVRNWRIPCPTSNATN